jgi:tetratricopeptide (TPR) repeat protein
MAGTTTPPTRSDRGGAGGRRRWVGLLISALLIVGCLIVVPLAVWRPHTSRRLGMSERDLALRAAAEHEPRAIPALVSLFHENPKDVPVIRALTTLAMVADDPDETLLWLDRWHAADPDDRTPIRLATEVASRTGRFDAVLHWGEKLLDTETDPVPILERLVTAELTLGRSEDAVTHARRLLTRGGTTEGRLLLLARGLFACGREDEAIETLEPLLWRDPPHVMAIAQCARRLSETEGAERVISMLRAALSATRGQPAGQSARHELARLLLAHGDRAEAEAVLREWERFEAAGAAARDAYQRPHDAALARKAAALLAETGQHAVAATLTADLAATGPVHGERAFTASTRIATSPERAGPDESRPGLFADVTTEAGLDFRHHGDASARHLIQETMGSGVAWIDYDRDGRPDLFCVQVTTEDTARPGHRLYRNVGEGRFIDVSDATGVGLATYGMGAEVGDIDNDGYDDLVVGHLSGVSLLQNVAAADGSRMFVDVTSAAGLESPHWATGLALFDADGDALLDLYVTNYVVLDPRHPHACVDSRSGEAQPCSPTAYDAAPDRIFRNLGGMRFQDMTDAWGLRDLPAAAGLGVIAVDLDQDGRCDLFVANDMHPAFLLRNSGRGFVDVGLLAGCSHGPTGRLMAGMGVVAADFDGSGLPSLFLTNFQFEPNVLFRALGRGAFVDHTYASGLGGPSHNALGFGTVALDADLDGALDLAVANGHVNRAAPRISAAPHAQPMQLFLGTGRGSFRDASTDAGSGFRTPKVGRGLAACDFDADGLPDLAVTENGGSLTLLHNRSAAGHSWIQLMLEGDGIVDNRSAIGARVDVETTARRQTRFICGGGSYLSASDRCLTFGLGEAVDEVGLTVTWPTGRTQVVGPLRSNRRWKITQGQDAVIVIR